MSVKITSKVSSKSLPRQGLYDYYEAMTSEQSEVEKLRAKLDAAIQTLKNQASNYEALRKEHEALKGRYLDLQKEYHKDEAAWHASFRTLDRRDDDLAHKLQATRALVKSLYAQIAELHAALGNYRERDWLLSRANREYDEELKRVRSGLSHVARESVAAIMSLMQVMGAPIK